VETSGVERGIPGVQGEVLFESPFVRFSSWKCTNPDSALTGERQLAFPAMAFPDRKPFFLHGKRGPVVAGRNEVLLHNAFSPFRTSHPFGSGDTGRLLALRGDVFADIARRHHPGAGGRPDAPFRAEIVPRTPRAQLLEHVLFRRAEIRDALSVEEIAVELGEEVIAAAAREVPPARRPSSTGAETVETAKALLSCRLGEPMGLESLASRLRCSPYSLMRAFRRSTGTSLHRYRTRARLHAAVERLLGGDSDLAQIGVDLGFSSHSHFTWAFRRVLGLTPSELRRQAFRTPARNTRELVKRVS
jgi:AraC-like DNA-binding protein